MYRYNGGGHIHRWLQDGSFPWEGQTISYGLCNRHIENTFSPLPGKWYFKGIKKAHGVKPRRIQSPSLSRLLLSCFRRQKYEENPEPPNKNGEILKNSRIFLLKIRISGYFPCFWGGMRNEKEWKGMILRNQSENDRKWPEMTGNDRNDVRITSGNDRKRPQDLPSVLPLRGMDSSEIPRFSVHFPRFSVHIPRNLNKIPYICIVFHF